MAVVASCNKMGRLGSS